MDGTGSVHFSYNFSFVRPIPRAVIDGLDVDILSLHGMDDNIRQPRNDQLACTFDLAGAAGF